MEIKKEFIADLANRLIAAGGTMTGQNLVDELNLNGHLTSYGTQYAGGRGVFRLIHATYDSLVAEGRQLEADDVADAFTDAYGHPAWDK